MGDTDQGAGCNGTCMGMCQGSCELSGMAALDCKGTCNGSCNYKPAMAKCEANAQVECRLHAEAKAECTGSCDGEFTPPSAECDASASCEASAKADAKFTASCTPPSIDIDFVLAGNLDATAQARFDFVLGEMRARLPRLFAALKKGNLVASAGVELAGDAQAAISGTVDALGSGDVDFVAAYRIGKCVPDQLGSVGTVVTGATAKLKGSFCSGFSLASGLGSTMDGVNNDICKS
jgi:hypothetical protein